MSDMDLDVQIPGVVAVVDDDVGIAQALHSWFTLISVPVQFFQDGQALLAALEQGPAQNWVLRDSGQPLIRVVVDLNLPGISGFEVARRLLAHAPAPGLNVVVMTAASEENMQALGGVPAGVSVMRKPFNLSELESWFEPPRI